MFVFNLFIHPFQKQKVFMQNRFFLLYHSHVLDKNCLNYARNGDFTLPFQEKVVTLQAK